jgi:hypothetical protein
MRDNKNLVLIRLFLIPEQLIIRLHNSRINLETMEIMADNVPATFSLDLETISDQWIDLDLLTVLATNEIAIRQRNK